MEAAEATVEDLLRVHTEAHVERVRQACRAAEERSAIVALDPDTKVSSASWQAAVGSAGTACAAAGAVAERRIRRAFVATRPPGHHATPDRAMGFCLFNSVAVTARWLQAAGYAERVLIVDWDVHHGNGTQDTFFDDPTVFFLSLHQWPHYPGSGSEDDIGVEDGLGFTLNVPLPAATPREEYLRAFRSALTTVLERFHPDFILVSAGFDVMAGDPLGGMLLEPADLHLMTTRLVQAAEAECDGRIVALLEGGCDPGRLGQGALAVIRALAGLESAVGGG